LIGLLHEQRASILGKLEQQAVDREACSNLLKILSATVPAFVTLVSGGTPGD
jgi:hypothetical protein